MKQFTCFSSILALFFLLLMLSAFGCRSRGRNGMSEVRIGLQDGIQSTPFVVAHVNGDFVENNILISFRTYPSGKLALMGIFDGEVDLAMVADMPVARAGFERNDFKIVCQLSSSSSMNSIIARRDHGISAAADLVGKTVATQKNSSVHYFLYKYLLYNNISLDKVNLVFKPAVELVDSIVDGDIDAFSMRNPYTSGALAKLGDNGLQLTDEYAYRSSFILAGRYSWIQGNQRAVPAILNALLQSETFINDQPGKTIEIMTSQLGKHRQDEIESDFNLVTFYMTLGKSLILTMEDEARWMIENGIVQDTSIPDYTRLIYFTGLDNVKPDRVSIVH
jgi:ABC-type nitrate/sulfonate/bicarbonate transport system substrate-binding protein